MQAVYYIIRAVQGRESGTLETYLRNRLPSAEWIIDEHSRGPLWSLRMALLKGMGKPVVYLEDDVLLTRQFEDKVRFEVTKRPTHIIQFFSRRTADLEEGSRWSATFTMTQCFYVPASLSESLFQYVLKHSHIRAYQNTPYRAIDKWMDINRMRHWIHVPSLVQHRPVRSMVNPKRSTRRQSITFV